MPTITTHLENAIVTVGSVLELTIAVDGGDDGVTFSWYHENEPVAGATGAAHRVDAVTTAHAGTWTVVATKDGTSALSSALVAVVDPDDTPPESPFVWRSPFATAAAWILGVAAFAVGLPLLARAWMLLDSDHPAGPTDAAIVATVAASIGIVLLAVTAFVIAVEVRGRATTPEPDGVGAAEVTPGGVATVVDAVGKLRGVQLVAVSGLLALGLAGLLGWRLAPPPDPAPTPSPTPTSSVSPTPG